MKNFLIGILFVTTVVFGGLYFSDYRGSTRAEIHPANLQATVSNLQSELREQAAETDTQRKELDQARVELAARTQEAARLREALKVASARPPSQPAPPAQSLEQMASSGETNSRTSSPLAEMFKNPDMKEMLKTQQKAVLGPMVDKNYAKLFSNLNLTPEQAAAVKDLIMKKQLDAATAGLSLVGDDLDSDKRADLLKQIKDASDATDAQLKTYLGDSNFAQYQAYEQSMAERNAISGFNDHLARGPNALTDAQQEQLLQVMTQEKQNFKFTTDFSKNSDSNGDILAMLTEERVNTFFQELGQLDQQYLTRAQAILSPDQTTEFGKYLKTQEGVQKASLQMAVKLLGPAKSGGK